MRSHVLRIAVCAILLTGYSYGDLVNTVRLNEGETLYAAVITSVDVVEKCYLETPNGETIELKPNYESNDKIELLPDGDLVKCHANVKIDANDDGLWRINSLSTTGFERSQSYNITVSPQPAITPEIQTERSQNFDTRLGANHTVFIRDYSFVTSTRCLIVTPAGFQYNLQGLNFPGLEVIRHRDGTCAVTINVNSDEVVGNWTLMAEGRRFTDPILRRQPFTIHVEEIVNASISEVIIVEGNDLYVRLRKSIRNYDTCRLVGPDGNEYDSYELDSRFTKNCGYIVRNVSNIDNGRWEIVYGNGVIYRAPINVTVTAVASEETLDVTWTKDRPLNETYGADNAVYCTLRNPDGLIVYDAPGRCKLAIDRVMTTHSGIWKMNVGLPGQVLTKNSELNVTIAEADPKPLVITEVVANRPNVSLTCQVSSPYPIRSCHFRDPSGRVLLVDESIGDSRYSFHGSGVSFRSNLHAHDCGLRIKDPVEKELGLWRCSVETEGETYYGFLRVVFPWAMRDPEVVAAITLDPTLRADRDVVSSVVGDAVVMSCSVQSAIRYCYFRARNGTLFNVGPADSHDQATYVGAGFDAGECGIRFPSLAVTDSGTWSCHVGLSNPQELEQRVRITVNVHDAMVANQRLENDRLIVEAQVYNDRALEYCRFVRIDGLGFTSTTTPTNYTDLSDLSTGMCVIAMTNPSVLDNHPWTVVARIRGQDVELARVTPITLPLPPGEAEVNYYHIPVSWIIILAIGAAMVAVAILIGPKSNRRWSQDRMNAIRNSFIKKKIEQQSNATAQQNNTDKNTAVAA